MMKISWPCSMPTVTATSKINQSYDIDPSHRISLYICTVVTRGHWFQSHTFYIVLYMYMYVAKGLALSHYQFCICFLIQNVATSFNCWYSLSKYRCFTNCHLEDWETRPLTSIWQELSNENVTVINCRLPIRRLNSFRFVR